MEERNERILKLGSIIEALSSNNEKLNAEIKRVRKGQDEALGNVQKLIKYTSEHNAAMTKLQDNLYYY